MTEQMSARIGAHSAGNTIERPVPSQVMIGWGARAGVAAPVLAVFATIVGSPLYTDELSSAATTERFTLAAAATLLVVLALVPASVSVYLAAAAGLRVIGHAGFVLAMAGSILVAGGAWDSLFTVPYLADEAPQVLDAETSGSLLAGYVISYLVFAIGWAVFATATLRAHALPRIASVMLLAGAILAIPPTPTSLRILPLALGVALACRAVIARPQHERRRASRDDEERIVS